MCGSTTSFVAGSKSDEVAHHGAMRITSTDTVKHIRLSLGTCILNQSDKHSVYALGELAVMYPVSGGFYTYYTRFIDPSWGFAMGWNYVFQWAIVLPLEINVAAVTLGYWPNAKSVHVGVWMFLFWTFIIIINVFGTLGYAEEEF